MFEWNGYISSLVKRYVLLFPLIGSGKNSPINWSFGFVVAENK